MSLEDMYSYKDLSDNAVLEFIRKHPDPVVTAPEVAEAFEITNQAANKRLRNLHDRGDVHRKKVGGSAVIYWVGG